MRVTNNQLAATLRSSLNDNSEKVSRLTQQMASGERLLLPSDDPIASVRVLRIQRSEANLSQFRSNIANVSGSLSTQEANLQSMSDSLLSMRDMLVWAGNGSNTADDLGAMSSELGTLEQTVVSYLNVRDEEGRYLFSGTLSKDPSVTWDEASGSYLATGNDQRRQAAVANGVLVDENVTAQDMFGGDLDFLNSLHALVGRLADPDLDNTDPAVRQQIADTLDLLDVTHGDVLGAVTELGGRQNTLSLLNDSNEDVSLTNQRIDGELSDLDYAGASIDLTSYQTALQASMRAYLQVNELSLFSLM